MSFAYLHIRDYVKTRLRPAALLIFLGYLMLFEGISRGIFGAFAAGALGGMLSAFAAYMSVSYWITIRPYLKNA